MVLRDKVLFGSDFPVIQVDRWMADFTILDIKPEVTPLASPLHANSGTKGPELAKGCSDLR